MPVLLHRENSAETEKDQRRIKTGCTGIFRAAGLRLHEVKLSAWRELPFRIF